MRGWFGLPNLGQRRCPGDRSDGASTEVAGELTVTARVATEALLFDLG